MVTESALPSAAALAQAEVQFPMAELRRMLLGARPRFYAMQPLKAGLIALLGADAAAARLMEAAQAEGTWRARRLPWRPLQDHAREHGLAYDELAPARLMRLAGWQRLGQPPDPARIERTRTVFRAVIANAVVCSKSNFILVDDVALLDVQQPDLAQDRSCLDVDPLVLAVDDQHLAVIVADHEPTAVLDEALSLVGLHSYAFGHWVCELLPKLWACSGLPGFERVCLLVDEQMPPQLFEALRLTMPAGQPLRIVRPGERVQVRNLWAVSSPVFFPTGTLPKIEGGGHPEILDAEFFARLLVHVESRWLPQVQPMASTRLYLGRAAAQHRRLLNRDAVVDWHRAQGFEIHDFNSMGFLKQLSLIRSAKVIVGPEGSSLFCTFFAAPGTRIATLAGPRLDLPAGFADIAAERRQPLYVLQGTSMLPRAPGAYFDDYTIDVARLPELHERLLASSDGAG
jgi:hypothetical protein